ncbi:transcription factor Ken-like isoform X1 [Schistocerca nitens]|uniref:transcription factor Ken-like isoform X1 n=1 Tax=Schistocerca nitens TaxID=7011 RepID=UPI00211858A2|nr:transcription factor Ken-like isoform X1 [Schistocerca nitens]
MAWQFYCPRHYGLTMNAVNDFVQQHSFVDVKLVCKNKKTVYSHKLILASASPFLKAVIEEMSNSDDMATLFLPDFDYNIVTLLLTFLCEGIMKLTWEELGEFRELCNGLGMNFPGADVVKVLNESHYSQTSQATDIAANPNANTERGIRTSSSLVSSREAFHTPAKVPDTSSAFASIVPKIEDCEDCQNIQLTQPVPRNDSQNTVQNLDVRNIQHSLTDSDYSQTEEHTQMSLETSESVMYSNATSSGGSWRKVMCSHSDTHTDLNVCHAKSSMQKSSQSNETSRMHSLPSVPMSVEQDNFHSSNSHFAHQKSSTHQIVKQSKATEQSAYHQIKKQSKAKTKKLHSDAGVQKTHLTQILNSCSVHKKLPELPGATSHKIKLSPHVKSSSRPSNSKGHSKTQSVQKYVRSKKRKNSEGSGSLQQNLLNVPHSHS